MQDSLINFLVKNIFIFLNRTIIRKPFQVFKVASLLTYLVGGGQPS